LSLLRTTILRGDISFLHLANQKIIDHRQDSFIEANQSETSVREVLLAALQSLHFMGFLWNLQAAQGKRRQGK
jgi:hypothetical protein